MIHRPESLSSHLDLHRHIATSPDRFRDPRKDPHPRPALNPAGPPATREPPRGCGRGQPGSQLTAGLSQFRGVWLGCPTFDSTVGRPRCGSSHLGVGCPKFHWAIPALHGSDVPHGWVVPEERSVFGPNGPARWRGTSHANLGRPTFSDGQLSADTPAEIAELI